MSRPARMVLVLELALALGAAAPARADGVTERVSVGPGGIQGNAYSGSGGPPGLSADGRSVAFRSEASNLVPGDTNGVGDVFVHTR